MTDISNIRTDYTKDTLSKKNVLKNPIQQFESWFNDAKNADIKDFNAMTLCTVDKKGAADGRIVLLKDISDNGFTFFTNYNSDKGKQLSNNPEGALVFFWSELERQVRVRGTIQKVSEEESNDYFKNRPHGSRLGAWASLQSKVIENRTFLENQLKRYIAKFGEEPIARPEHWGGYRLNPTEIEFWQGGSLRLHDRILFTKSGDDWKIERLAP